MARESCSYQDIFNYIVHGNTYPDATDNEKTELLKEAIQYTVIQGNLYRTYPSACKKLHLVLSKQRNQKNAIFESHILNDKHLSIKETCLNVRKKYHWKSIDNDVVEFVKQCPDCNEDDADDDESFPMKDKHQQYEYLDRVWKLVEVTVIGPLTHNETKVYLFRLGDVFSKWVCFHKLNSLDLKEISKILLKEFSVLGFPDGIRLVGLENSEEIINLFENEIKEFIEKTKEVNKIFNSDISTVTNDSIDEDVSMHQDEIDHSPKINSECANLPISEDSEEMEDSPLEVNGDGNNNCNSIDDNNEIDDANNNGDGDNNNSGSNNNNSSSEADITLPSEKTEVENDLKSEEIKTAELDVEETNKESLSDLTNSIPNGSEPVLQENTVNSTLENEVLFQKIKETDEFFIDKLDDFEIFVENRDENAKPFIYIFIGEKSIIDSETENLYKEKLDKFINHFPNLWVEYLPSFTLNIQNSISNSFQIPNQVMFHREPNLLGLFESSYLNNLIQFPDVESQSPVKNNIANGSRKVARTSKRMRRYSLRQSPKPNEALGFFNDYIRTSPIKRATRSFYSKRDCPPLKMRKLSSKQDLIHSLVEKYCLKDTFVVLQPLPSTVVESALAGNVKVANPPPPINEKEVPAEKSSESTSLSLPSSSKEINSEEMSEANKENNENHPQLEQEVAVR